MNNATSLTHSRNGLGVCYSLANKPMAESSTLMGWLHNEVANEGEIALWIVLEGGAGNNLAWG